jgi:hypothetical protein
MSKTTWSGIHVLIHEIVKRKVSDLPQAVIEIMMVIKLQIKDILGDKNFDKIGPVLASLECLLISLALNANPNHQVDRMNAEEVKAAAQKIIETKLSAALTKIMMEDENQ